MYTVIYRPKRIEQFIGNNSIIEPFIQWLLEWDPSNKKNKCALVSGSVGIGKSLFIDLILEKYNYNIINITCDEEYTSQYFNCYIKPIIKTKKSFSGHQNVIVVSDINAISDHGFMSNLLECIKESLIPIICICDDMYSPTIKTILNYCYNVKMKPPKYDELYRFIYNIVINEKIKIKDQQIKDLYNQSNGDVRFILNSLQLNVISPCIKTINKNIEYTNIFETTGILLSMDESIERKNEVYWAEPNIHTLMVQENYINNIIGIKENLSKLEKLVYSSNALSDADLFNSYDCNWELINYMAINTICATSQCNKKSIIKFPQYLGKISTQNKNKKDKLNYEYVKFFKNEKEKETQSKDVKKNVKDVKKCKK